MSALVLPAPHRTGIRDSDDWGSTMSRLPANQEERVVLARWRDCPGDLGRGGRMEEGEKGGREEQGVASRLSLTAQSCRPHAPAAFFPTGGQEEVMPVLPAVARLGKVRVLVHVRPPSPTRHRSSERLV